MTKDLDLLQQVKDHKMNEIKFTLFKKYYQYNNNGEQVQLTSFVCGKLNTIALANVNCVFP